MDVRSILLSVEEREKWRHRLERLSGALAEVQSRRRTLERELKTMKREIERLGAIAEHAIDPERRRPLTPIYGASEGRFPRR